MGRACSGVGCVQGPLPTEPKAEGRACLHEKGTASRVPLAAEQPDGCRHFPGQRERLPFLGSWKDGWKAGPHGDEEQQGI